MTFSLSSGVTLLLRWDKPLCTNNNELLSQEKTEFVLFRRMLGGKDDLGLC